MEVLFATVILALGALALGSTLIQGHRLGESVRAERRAHDAMRDAMTDILATPFPEVAERFNGSDFAVAGLEAGRDDADGLPGEILFEYGPDSDRLYRVTVRVTWSAAGSVHSVSTVRYLSNVRGDPGVPPPLGGAVAGDLTITTVAQPITSSAGAAIESAAGKGRP